MNPDSFIAAARSMLGVPFMHQGRNAKLGVDCAGLAVLAARECGFEVEDYTDYQRTPAVSDFIDCLLRHCEIVKPGSERAGDLWIFQFAGNPQHLAIQTGPDSMIHAYALFPRKVIEHRIDEQWRAKRAMVFRIKEQ